MFKKLGALLLTGALCAALTLPALAAEMTLPLGKSGENVILSDVVSTEKKTVTFRADYFSDDGDLIKKEITIYHLGTDCKVTFPNSENPGKASYKLIDGCYHWNEGGVCRNEMVLNGNPTDSTYLIELVSNGYIKAPNLEGLLDETQLPAILAASRAEVGIFCVPAPPIAYAAPQTVLVDGKEVKFDAYAKKDENGNMTNYFKARDVASVLSGTAAQFNVGWEGNVLFTSKTAYTPTGDEMTTPFTGNRPYKVLIGYEGLVKVNGSYGSLNNMILTDDKGGAYTYYNLRDLGEAMGFKVDWNGKNVTIDTTAA